MQTVRVGILGAGLMARVHAQAFRQIPDVEIVGFTARRHERAVAIAAQLGGRAYSSEQELVEDPAVDVVDNTYPTFRHRELTEQSFAAGKHVICEKPIAQTLEDAEAMIAAGERAGRHLYLAHCVRFWPGYRDLRRIVASGDLGRPLVASAVRVMPFPEWSDWIWNAELTAGGPVMELMIHDFDLLNWIFGVPRSVHCVGRPLRTGTADHLFATLRYGDAEAAVEGSMMMPRSWPFTSTLRVVCEQGTLEYAFRAAGANVDSAAGMNTLTLYPAQGEPHRVPFEEADAYLIQALHFVDCLRLSLPPQIGTARESLDALRVSLAARRSLEEGREVGV